ncbi:glycosyl hydrolase 53 family protein [Gracilibacillus alcaliphilus]|uniref:glycosyl hydrolase 53 family protein n=1 Tax=Gracilibacillus alcaliphilus TaxID=1401441 RepID=UPI001955FA3B|nr:glycosyl hydrolase 53 family protein [Gracilibacillus alcaliphilus]MBM7679073.1 arabinogalactan endo-1,4-beta-galactosidase [Gracilibacillus alcaliphilus]
MRKISICLLAAVLWLGFFVPDSMLSLREMSNNVYAASNSDFIMGGDVSMLHEVEELGGAFYEQGVEKDALEILSANGMNYVRLRLWVDPYDTQGNPYGGGTNDLQTALSLAKRAKAQGMEVLLNLHYSDFWADPGTQTKPKSWQNLSYNALKNEVYQYSKGVIEAFKQEGVLPKMVQVGNETTSGILWDDGKVGAGYNDFTQLAELFSAGISGIQDALSSEEEVEIVLHLDHGGDNRLYRWWFDEITNLGVDFDIIGLSYYPFWHGTMGELHYNMNDISNRYNKDVMIVETAYGFTLDDGDGLGNSFFEEEERIGGYPASPQGQMEFMNDLQEIVEDIPDGRGRGIFWWEPAWIPVEGANWGTEAGKLYNDDHGLLSNPWDNQTLFDFHGNVLESVAAFQYNTPDNLVKNHDFEVDGWTNTPTDWGVWTEAGSSKEAVFTESPGINGDYKLTHWSDQDYTVSTYQVIDGLEDGDYTFSAWVLNSGGQDDVYIYAKNFGSNELQQALPVSPDQWVKIEIDHITVTNGQCEIGIISYANAGNWMNIDNVKFYKN